MKSILAATALLGGLAFGTAAHADPITYQFDIDPLFVGGTMAGTFTFNAATNQESNVSITIASNPDDGGLFNGVYSQIAPISPPATAPTGSPATDLILGTSSTGNQAWVGFSAPLTPAGGLITLYGAIGPAPNEFEEFLASGSGRATPVPEPATLALLTVGLVGLGLQRRARLPVTPPATPPGALPAAP